MTGKIYGQKKDGKVIERGSAYPVCVSVNECVCNNSPLKSEPQVRGKD
jgi:methionine aminopeptidase